MGRRGLGWRRRSSDNPKIDLGRIFSVSSCSLCYVRGFLWVFVREDNAEVVIFVRKKFLRSGSSREWRRNHVDKIVGTKTVVNFSLREFKFCFSSST